MDAIISFVILGIFSAATPVIPLPGYLLLMWYDGFQNTFAPGLPQPEFFIGQVLYIVVLAVFTGVFAQILRQQFNIGDPGQSPLSDVAVPLAAVFSIVGLQALFLGILMLILGEVNFVPIGLGILFLLGSAGLLRYTVHYGGNHHAATV